jgi:CPA1 family monovalent cation:H+ antiporter
VATTLGLALLRLTWVWLSLRINMLRRRYTGEQSQPPGWRLILATSLAGVRGAVTLAGILTLPLLMPDGSPFPARGLAIFLAAAVIVLSLIGASIGLPRLLKGLELPREPAQQREEDHARAAAAVAAIEAVTQAQHAIQQQTPPTEAEVCADAARRVIANYQRRIQESESKGVEATHLRQADAMERRLRLAGLRGERTEILDLARNRDISDETARRLMRELDLLETIYR